MQAKLKRLNANLTGSHMPIKIKAAQRLLAMDNADECRFLLSLGRELESLKCKVSNMDKLEKGTFNAVLPVKATKYPFLWCMKKLGWHIYSVPHNADTVGRGVSSSMTHFYLKREDGSWPLEVYWKGMNYIQFWKNPV